MADIIFALVFTAILAIGGIVILIGKGDSLIAGYNTASESEKKKYHIKRLRGLIGGLLVVMALLYFLLMREYSVPALVAFVVISTVLAIITLVLANTWAKKK